MIRPPTLSTKLKTKRRCTNSFFITDILGNRSRSPSPTSANNTNHDNPTSNENHLLSSIGKDAESGDDDDTMLHDSDDNGKWKTEEN